MEENRIGEIRGIAENQNIESNMELILEEKLKDFPNASMYKKKVSDMKLLTNIYNKYLNKEELTKDELRFLYGVEGKILGFGFDDDPRVSEIIITRNKRKDLAYILDCSEEEICLSEKELDLKKTIKYYDESLNLKNLTSAEGLILPKIVNGDLNLYRLTDVKGLVFPEIVNGDLWLITSEIIKDLKLPKIVNGNLYLFGLTSVDNLILPEIIYGNLVLGSMTTLVGVTLPNIVSGDVEMLYSRKYTLDEIKEMQQEEIRNKNIKLSGKSSGYVTNVLLIVNIILFGILVFIIGLGIFK